MRILYCGFLSEVWTNTCTQRKRALEQLGHEVIPFDFSPFYDQGRSILQRILTRLSIGGMISSLNAAMVQAAKNAGKVDRVWVDKAIYIRPPTLRSVRQITSAKLIHYTPDPALLFHRTRNFQNSIEEYDVCLTTKKFEMGLYDDQKAKKVIFAPKGVETSLFHPKVLDREKLDNLACDILFVGHGEEYYGECLEAAVSVSAATRIYGDWKNVVVKKPSLAQYWRGRGIFNADYVDQLCAAKIALGLMSRYIPEQITCRNYEIPACQTMMIAPRSEELQETFEEGKEAEYFDTIDELVDKLRFYLKNDTARSSIAKRGHARFVESKYDLASRMSLLLHDIESHLASVDPHAAHR